MAGDTRSTIVLGSGLQVDLRVVPDGLLRRRPRLLHGLQGAQRQAPAPGGREGAADLRVRRLPGPGRTGADGDCIAGREEADVYATVGLAWIPPELREDRARSRPRPPAGSPISSGSRTCAATSTCTPPGRTAATDRGDGRGLRRPRLRVHGDLGPQQVAGDDRRARRLPPAPAVAGDRRGARPPPRDPHPALHGGGHPGRRLARPRGRDARRARPRPGLPPLPASTSRRTSRPSGCCSALEHPEVNVFCHPTARIINRRKPAEFDLDVILRRAAELGVAVELNSSPNRLDLKDSPPRARQRAGLQGGDRHRLPPHPRARPDALRRRAGPPRRAGARGTCSIRCRSRSSRRRSSAERTLPRPRGAEFIQPGVSTPGRRHPEIQTL